MSKIDLLEKTHNAIASKDIQELEFLLVNANARKSPMLHQLFLSRATKGDLTVLRVMAPHFDMEQNTDALARVVGSGHKDCFEFLLPFADPRTHSKRMLDVALLYKRVEIIDALIPLCNICDLHTPNRQECEAQLLQERITVHEQQTISAHMPNKGSATKKKI